MDIQCIDLAPAFEQAIEADRGSLFLDGVHLSPEGHRVAAEAIHASLIELGFITP